ncbi:chemotaxis protein CheW [Anaerovorax odorimutans]|uniref:chemotaxis protein CheW n=1 Tax=Anaerovorax odorimutans TaxID=109327 RepID=UPI0003FD6F29|nr:chemotaxis protein CheW [Anaerovorax odorimutans]
MANEIERDTLDITDNSEALNDNTKKFLTFLSDELYFAVDIGYVIEIITSYNITHLPRVPEYVTGIINLRGQIIPIVDIRIRTGRPLIEYTDKSCIIVLEINSMMIGIIVDEVSHVVDVKTENISPSPSKNKQELVNGIARVDSTVNLILDCESLVQ